VKKTILFIFIFLIIFITTNCKNSSDIIITETLVDISVEDVEVMTDYTFPRDTVIVSIETFYHENALATAYLHIRISKNDITLFTNNFPDERKIENLTAPFADFLSWCGLDVEKLDIYAVYEELYLSTKYSSVNIGDVILITKAINEYYDVYINKDKGDERPTTKAWGMGEKIEGNEGRIR
jgi:hypothetical protein